MPFYAKDVEHHILLIDIYTTGNPQECNVLLNDNNRTVFRENI